MKKTQLFLGFLVHLHFCFSNQMFLAFHFLFCITLIIHYLSQDDGTATKWPRRLDCGALEESSDLSRIKTGQMKGFVWRNHPPEFRPPCSRLASSGE